MEQLEKGREDTIRVLRVIEYRGPRAAVEFQVERSLHGTKRLPNGVIISAATVGEYPEIIDNPIPDPSTFGRPTREVVLGMEITDLNLSVRACNCLASAGIENVSQLVVVTGPELMLIKHLGRRTLREIEEELAGYGLSLPVKKNPRA